MKEAGEPQEEAPQEEAPQEEAPQEEAPQEEVPQKESESPKKESPKKPRVPRESTMAVTAQVVCMFGLYACTYSIAIKST